MFHCTFNYIFTVFTLYDEPIINLYEQKTNTI